MLVRCGARLDYGADENLDQSRACGVQHNRAYKPRIRVWQQRRQHGEREQTNGGQQMCECHTAAVAHAVDELCRYEVDRELRHKIDGHEQGKALKRDAEIALKYQKQQRQKIVDYRLADIAYAAGGDGWYVALACLFRHSSVLLRSEHPFGSY